MLSPLDRAIAGFSPRWAARRAMDRARLAQAELVERQVNGIKRRYSEDFRLNDQQARVNGRAMPRGPMSRADREKLWRLFRFNPFARKAMNTLLGGLVGFGIVGAPAKASKAVQQDWADWQKLCDWDGVLDFAGLQELIVKTYLLDAAVFVVFRVASGVTGNPLRLQVLSIDQLASSFSSTGVVAGSVIRHGIEYLGGKPIAYHFRTDRDAYGNLTTKTERILASDLIHFFERAMPGQWWGWPHFEPVVDALIGIDDYLEAEGVRKRIESCFVGMVTRSIDVEPAPIGEVDQNPAIGPQGEELRAESFYPGMIMYGEPGEDVKFGEPKAAGGLAEYLRWGGIRAAAGAQVTYEGMTGDLSNVNFSSYRAGENYFKRFCGRQQWTVGIIPRVLDPIWTRFCTVQVGTGRMPQTRAPGIVWTPPAFETIDRQGDATAAILEMSAGLESRRSLLGERGYDFEQKMREIADDKKLSQGELGLTFSGDLPVTVKGLPQPQSDGTDQNIQGDANAGADTADA